MTNRKTVRQKADEIKDTPSWMFGTAFGLIGVGVLTVLFISPHVSGWVASVQSSPNSTSDPTATGIAIAEAAFAGLAMAGVIVTLWMQRLELRHQRQQLLIQAEEAEDTRKVLQETQQEARRQAAAMTRQVFESGFFHLLEAVYERRTSAAVTARGVPVTGKEAIEFEWGRLHLAMGNARPEHLFHQHCDFQGWFNDAVHDLWREPAVQKYGHEGVAHRRADALFDGPFRTVPGEYIRLLSCLVQYIDRGELTQDEKRWYVRLLHAQINNADRGIAVYYALTTAGRAEFAAAAHRVGFFDGFVPSILPKPEHFAFTQSSQQA